MEAHLSSRHRDTVERIFRHPASRNNEWHDVVSLLETIGTVTRALAARCGRLSIVDQDRPSRA